MSLLKQALPAVVQELRIHFCQSGSSSAGARAFVMKNYKALKAANPALPILVRECAGVEPQAFARFEMGKEAKVALAGLDEAAVAKALETLAK